MTPVLVAKHVSPPSLRRYAKEFWLCQISFWYNEADRLYWVEAIPPFVLPIRGTR